MIHTCHIKKRNALAFLLMIFFTYFTFAENSENYQGKIDSINEKAKIFCKNNFDSVSFFTKQALKLSDEFTYPKGKMNALSVLADAHLYLNSMDSSLAISNQIIENTSGILQLGEYRFSAFYRICKIYHYKGEYPMALQAANNAIKGIDPDSDDKYFAMIYNLKGLTYKRTGEFVMAQEQFIEALAHVNDENYYLRSIILTNLGIVNRNMEQYPQALNYYDKALNNSEMIHDTIGIGLLYQNVAAVYSDLNENKKSLSYNLLAMDIIRNNNYNSIEYATLLNNIGLNYEGLNLPDSAIKYLNKALILSIDLDDPFGIADTKINLGRVYLKNNRLVLAHKNINEGINIAKNIEADDLAIEGYEVLIDYEVANNNYKSAFYTQKLLNSLHDSVYNIEKANAINELQEKYETEKKEQRIEIQNIELQRKNIEIQSKNITLENERIRKYFLIVALLLVVIIFIIFFVYQQKVQNRKQEAEQSRKEKEIAKYKLLIVNNQISPHFTYNAINSVKELIASEQKDKAIYAFTKFANLIKATLQGADSYMNSIKDELDFVVLFLDFMKYKYNDKFTFELNVDSNVDTNFLIPRLAIQELVENSIKHGIRNKATDDGFVKIDIQQTDDYYLFTVKDNGVGISEAKKKHTSGTGKGIYINSMINNIFNKNNIRPSIKIFEDIFDDSGEVVGVKAILKIPVEYKFIM